MEEKTLVLLKHDTVKRGLIGKIITRLEDAGLKIVAMKMIHADESLAKNHYKMDEQWAKNVFEKNKAAYEKEGKKIHYKDHMEMGNTIQSWNVNFLTEGPIIAMVLSGNHAIELVRKMVGATEPRQALPGTIRGDFASTESYVLSDTSKRVLRNLIHASDSVANANLEIELWFTPSEITSYKTVHDLSLPN